MFVVNFKHAYAKPVGVAQMCSDKTLFLKSSQISEENNCKGVLFMVNLQTSDL